MNLAHAKLQNKWSYIYDINKIPVNIILLHCYITTLELNFVTTLSRPLYFSPAPETQGTQHTTAANSPTLPPLRVDKVVIIAPRAWFP